MTLERLIAAITSGVGPHLRIVFVDVTIGSHLPYGSRAPSQHSLDLEQVQTLFQRSSGEHLVRQQAALVLEGRDSFADIDAFDDLLERVRAVPYPQSIVQPRRAQHF